MQDIYSAIGGTGAGTKNDPWRFSGGFGQPPFHAYRDKAAIPPMLVIEVGGQALRYPLDRLDDLGISLPPLPPGPARHGGLASHASALIRRTLDWRRAT